MLVRRNQPPVLTQDTVARIFAKENCETIRYDETRQVWCVWNGTHWQKSSRQIIERIRELCRELACDLDSNVKVKLGSASFIKQVKALSESDSSVVVTSAVWDRDPMLLGTPDGTVDLRTGRLRPAQPGDMITKLTAVGPSPDEDCPRFKAFLCEITQGQVAVANFFIRWFGYCLSGETKEQKLLFLHGPGGNGKGVLTNTIGSIMGDYAKVASMTTFTARTFDSHPEELASLEGARLVTASETEFGKHWAEARIKELTGGDPISCRHLYKDRYSYRPSFKLTFSGNHPPSLQEVNQAIKRRFILAYLGFTPPEIDPDLETKLIREGPAILRMLINGCCDWYKNGLQMPPALQIATSEYLTAQDPFSEWVAEQIELMDNDEIYTASFELFRDWAWFAEARGEKSGNDRLFAERMRRATNRRPTQIKALNKKGYRGVRLKERSRS